MNFEEKLKELNIDKGQIIIFSVMTLIIIFIFYGLLSASDDNIEVYNDLDVPEHKSITEYETKLEAYAKENEAKEDTYSLNFDRAGVFGIDSTNIKKTEREKLEAKVDSMLNLSKREDFSYLINNEESITDQVKQSKIVVEEINRNSFKKENSKSDPQNAIDINEFFNKKPPLETVILPTNNQNTAVVRAIIHNNQKIKNNERVVLRLKDDLKINDKIYERNSFIYAFSKFSKNRVYLTINNIENNKVLYNAYDIQDGNLGLYIEGANIGGELEKEGANEVLQEMNLNDVPLGSAVKKIFRKKNREISVLLLNGYEVILKNEL